jgi:hypothetical protein
MMYHQIKIKLKAFSLYPANTNRPRRENRRGFLLWAKLGMWYACIKFYF